jgi:hypothetical protein
MAFERDVFISYAHIDNMPLEEGEPGWVSIFHKALEVRLAQLMGERPQVWRDPKLQGNDVFGDEIAEQLHKAALMVSILSPGYVKSEWCSRELREFCEAAAGETGIKIGNKCRVFKVIKTDVPYTAHPEEIADILGYKFFVIDPESGRARELNLKAESELEQNYRAKLYDVAYDMRDLLGKLKNGRGMPELGNGRPITIYLAETSHDLETQRDMIKRELAESGCEVLPDRPLPLLESEFKKSVAAFLDQADLAIHLVGRCYGSVPEGCQESIPVLQNELAVQKSKAGKFPRLIWLHTDGKIEDERQTRFVNLVRTDAEILWGADMLETSIEEFKNAIHDKLNAMQAAGAAAVDKPTVYLAETNYYLEEQRDGIKQWLTERGYGVLPDQDLPLVYAKSIETIDHMLNRCAISIHLLGKEYGVVPDNTDKSIIRIQYEQAGGKSRQGRLRRLIWFSPEINREDNRQRLFIDRVKADPHPGDEIIDTPLTDLKAKISQKLPMMAEKKPEGSEEEKPPQDIYLLCDRRDLDQVKPLEDFLYYSGCNVILPAFKGEESELQQNHRENLKSCHAVMIYYGQANDLWLRSIYQDLKKIAGYGRVKPLLPKALFLAPPATKEKEHCRFHDTLMIDGTKGYSNELLEPFIEILKSITR